MGRQLERLTNISIFLRKTKIQFTRLISFHGTKQQMRRSTTKARVPLRLPSIRCVRCRRQQSWSSASVPPKRVFYIIHHSNPKLAFHQGTAISEPVGVAPALRLPFRRRYREAKWKDEQDRETCLPLPRGTQTTCGKGRKGTGGSSNVSPSPMLMMYPSHSKQKRRAAAFIKVPTASCVR